MKIARLRDENSQFWASVDVEHDRATPLNGKLEDWTERVQRGEPLTEFESPGRATRLSGLTLLAPLEPTGKVVCIGMNYRSHVEALPNGVMPTQPMGFLKASTAVIAHGDDLVYPPLTHRLDYELELVVVIGRPASADAPTSAILGYTVGNDGSARDLQKSPAGRDLYAGKSLDDTSGVGPFVATFDEIGPDPDLEMTLRVNGEVRQHDRTSGMEWKVAELVKFVNERTRLLPGDLIFTGTPAGVGVQDGRFLQVGDVVEAEIERLGLLRNTVVAK